MSCRRNQQTSKSEGNKSYQTLFCTALYRVFYFMCALFLTAERLICLIFWEAAFSFLE